jgi:hypothetical protein
MKTNPENWKAVPDFPEYEVSDLGQVRRVDSGRILSPSVDEWGRRRVNLWRANRYKTVKVHRLVALAFIGPQPDGHEVAHRDGNAANNQAGNLMWATPTENNAHKKLHGTQPMGEKVYIAKMTDQQVAHVKTSYTGKRGELTGFARMFGVSRWAIRNLLNGKSWGSIHA